MSFRFAAALLAAAVGLSGCNLLNTLDGEKVSGRGSVAFDPYQSVQSGAIRLSLSYLNGCAILPTGETAAKGSANIPYPSNCGPLLSYQANPKEHHPLSVLAGANYFLNEIQLMETVENKHTDPARLDEVSQWFRSVPKFGNLDWTGLGIDSNEYLPSRRSPTPGAWNHRVTWANAAWQQQKDDTFTVEVLDSGGTVRARTSYKRSEFLVENPFTEHTMMFWEQDNIAAPQDPNSTTFAPAPAPPPGFPPVGPVTTQSGVKVELVTSTVPQHQFQIPSDLSGSDGAIRLTWSQLPNDPFYFPVTFVKSSDLPDSCYSGTDPTQAVKCNFGVQPKVVLSSPNNGKFYMPGERIQVQFLAQDAAGNYLYSPSAMPSFKEYQTGSSNGLLYFNPFNIYGSHDIDTITSFQIAGPKNAMRPIYELNDRSFYRVPTQQYISGIGNEGQFFIDTTFASLNLFPGIQTHHPSTTYNFTIPADAKPGTYMVTWKVNRYFLGERLTKAAVQEFQVGQAEKTGFPNRVGNCQMCHRGVLSLENVRHGLSVDYVEGCKACHNRDQFVSGRQPTQALFHAIHMNSAKFPRKKNDCTTCHLTRESALRPSYVVCASCHPRPHGGEFESLALTTDDDPNNTNTVYSTCGVKCHVNTPPTAHILPQE